jgi:hypothetical protein
MDAYGAHCALRSTPDTAAKIVHPNDKTSSAKTTQRKHHNGNRSGMFTYSAHPLVRRKIEKY